MNAITRLVPAVSSNGYKASQFNTVAEAENGTLVIYNALTNILSVLTAEEKAFYLGFAGRGNDQFSDAEIELLDRMLVNNYVIPIDVDEVAGLERTYVATRNAPGSVVLTITPTLNCNFGCRYCYQGQEKDALVMSADTQDKTIAFIKSKVRREHGIKNLNITWFGGEPLMGLSAIKNISDQVIAWCDKQGIAYSGTIVTNGFMLNERTAGELYVRRVTFVQITIDGDRDTHNSIRALKKGNLPTFERIVENIAAYTENYPMSTVIRVNIDENNAASIHTLIDQLAAAGLGHKSVKMYFAPVVASTSACRTIGQETLDIKHFSKVEHDLTLAAIKAGFSKSHLPPRFMGICGASRPGSGVIAANGDLHRCWDTVMEPAERVGKLAQAPTEQELAKNEMWDKWTPFNNEHCRKCSILPNCAGFCAYKYLYKHEFSGKSGELPCPSLKFNIKDRILSYAASNGML
jgi:uncharacterized protein